MSPETDRAEYKRAWRKANAERIKAQDAAYREAHREERNAYSRAYRRSEVGQAKQRQMRAEEAASGRKTARHAVWWAVQTGRIVKTACVECGEAKVEAHHHRGYEGDAKLDVTWLCRTHHELAHHPRIEA